MSDDLVKQALAEIGDVVRCCCHEAYTGRKMHDPACNCDSADAVRVVADHIKELEAKLAKAVEALDFYADGEWPQDYPGGVLYASGDDTPEFKTHLDYGDKARATLAELKEETTK